MHSELNLDLSRAAVAGASLGGYFALRTAADPRTKACVALDQLYSLWDFATAHVSPLFLGAWDRGWLSDWLVDTVISLEIKTGFRMRWEVSIAGTFFGIESPVCILREMKRCSFANGSDSDSDRNCPERVRCAVLVTGSLSLFISMLTIRQCG